MGLILDTSVLIAGERRGISVLQILDSIEAEHGPQQIELSVITIAELTHGIEGEQAAIGNAIAFQDLVIGATALSLGFKVLTANIKHFILIPSLSVVSF